jgi:hypothetical protein
VELAILRVDRRIVPQNFLHHDRVAVERGADGQKVVVPGREWRRFGVAALQARVLVDPPSLFERRRIAHSQG